MQLRHLLFSLGIWLLATSGWSATTPDDLFFDSAALIHEAELAASKADWSKAKTKYAAALVVLKKLRAEHPDWNTLVVEFRIRTYTTQLAELQATPPPQPATPPPPAPELARIQQLTADLDYAQQQITELHTVREQLTTKLRQSATNTTAELRQTTDQVAALTAQSHRLHEQLAESQRELSTLRRQATAKIFNLRDAIMEAGANSPPAAPR